MTTLVAGSELDRRVAEAIGAQFTGSSLVDGDEYALNGKRFIRPSTDLNAAFAAAEKVGLFDHDAPTGFRHTLFRRNSEAWCLAGPAWCLDGPHLFGEGATPALAICAAILKLKESECPTERS